jgi:molybdate transport system substrate-binding protein
VDELRSTRFARTVLALVPLAFVLGACSRDTRVAASAPAELTVFAAASLRDALVGCAPTFEERTGTKLVFSFGSSGDLARQIVAAPSADVFVSAGEQELDRVELAGLAEPGTRRVIASNQLVVIETIDPEDPSRSFFDAALQGFCVAWPADARIALADVETVPAGRYAKAWLEHRQVWRVLEPRVLPAVDVRAALAAVESGAALFGVVYRTDVAPARRARIVHAVPLEEGPRIVYGAVAIRGRQELARARAFVEELAGPEGRSELERLGFLAPPPEIGSAR